MQKIRITVFLLASTLSLSAQPVQCNQPGTFWSMDILRNVLQWEMTGGQINLVDSLGFKAYSSLLYSDNVVDPAQPPTLFTSNDSIYYLDTNGWHPTGHRSDNHLHQGGGYRSDIYFMSGNISYYDGSHDPQTVASFSGPHNLYGAADLAVDSLGRVWCLIASGQPVWPTTHTLRAYDKTGAIVVEYPFETPVYTINAYGTMIIADTFFVGFGKQGIFPNAIVPIRITCGVARFGRPMFFEGPVFPSFDLASCMPGVPKNHCTTDTPELSEMENPVRLYPVPANDLVVVQGPAQWLADITQLRLYDVCGKQVNQINHPTLAGDRIEIPLVDLLPGLYYLCLEGPNPTCLKLLVGK